MATLLRILRTFHRSAYGYPALPVALAGKAHRQHTHGQRDYGGSQPDSVDMYRTVVPITTYDDYVPILGAGPNHPSGNGASNGESANGTSPNGNSTNGALAEPVVSAVSASANQRDSFRKVLVKPSHPIRAILLDWQGLYSPRPVTIPRGNRYCQWRPRQALLRHI